MKVGFKGVKFYRYVFVMICSEMYRVVICAYMKEENCTMCMYRVYIAMLIKK